MRNYRGAEPAGELPSSASEGVFSARSPSEATNEIGNHLMIKRYNNLSFLFFVPGIIGQLAGIVVKEKATSLRTLGIVLLIAGTVGAVTGFAYYAKAKGRSPAWGVAGLLGIPGLLLLSVLKDRSGALEHLTRRTNRLLATPGSRLSWQSNIIGLACLSRVVIW